MITSMTGYARKIVMGEDISYTVEIRTLNHRFLEIHPRLPEQLYSVEMEIRNLIKKHLARGRVDIRINAEAVSGEAPALNQGALQGYLSALGDIMEQQKLMTFDPVALLGLPGVLQVKAQGEVPEELLAGVEEALGSLSDNRRREGKLLWQDIVERLGIISGFAAELKELALLQPQLIGQRLRERLAQLVAEADERVAAEIAIMADKADVSEELVRLSAHIGEFLACEKLREPVGRRLDFLCQEMFREINTVGSKSADFHISRLAVQVKSELEKIREQVQNIE
jgi:uncharacterized protein (TIGR00255 family)